MSKQINMFQSMQWGSVKIREQTIEISLPFTLIYFKVIFLLLPIAVHRNLVPYPHGRYALCSRCVHSVYVMVRILGQKIKVQSYAQHFPNYVKWSEVKLLSHVELLATPWTAAYQAPPSMAFSRQEYWSGVPFPSPNYVVMDKLQNLLSTLVSD